MMRDGRLREIHSCFDVAGAQTRILAHGGGGVFLQRPQNTTARGISDRLQHSVERGQQISHGSESQASKTDMFQKLTVVNIQHQDMKSSDALPRGSQPLNAAELKISHIAFR